MTYKKDVIICVPVYKNELNENERLALKQLFNVLGNYQTCYVGPQHIDVEYYKKISPDHVQFMLFPNKTFKSIGAYSAFLTSASFYRSFFKYKYMLIYQTDAYVFKDELMRWVNHGVDFIGAPWTRPVGNPASPFNFSKFMVGRVGNGGFCLRKIESHYRVSKKWGWLWSMIGKNEDLFWSLIAPKLDRSFKTAGFNEGLRFAFEMTPEKCYKINNNNLPFGCHAWEKYNPDFWKAFIPFK